MSEIGTFLRGRREAQGRTIHAVAQASGLTPQSVENIESGGGLWSSVNALATALGTRITVRLTRSTRNVSDIARTADVSVAVASAVLMHFHGVAVCDPQLASVEAVVAAAKGDVSFR